MFINEKKIVLSLEDNELKIYHNFSAVALLSIPVLGLLGHIQIVKRKEWIHYPFIIFKIISYLLVFLIISHATYIFAGINFKSILLVLISSHMIFCGTDPFIASTLIISDLKKINLLKLKKISSDFLFLTMIYIYIAINADSAFFYIYSLIITLIFSINSYLSLKLIDLRIGGYIQ